jgi:hypothetical protein
MNRWTVFLALAFTSLAVAAREARASSGGSGWLQAQKSPGQCRGFELLI